MDDTKQEQPQVSELDRAYDALAQAHAAGNKEHAQQIADYIRTLQPPAPKAPPENLESPVLWGVGGAGLGVAGSRAVQSFEQGQLRKMAEQARVNVPEEVIQRGRNAVINYIKAMHTGDINYVGGESYKEAHALTEAAKEKAKMAPPGYRYDFESGQYLPEAEYNARQEQRAVREKARVSAEQRKVPFATKLEAKSPGTARVVSGAGNVLRKGIAPPFVEHSLAGYYGGQSAAEALNRWNQGDIPGAAISGTGTIGSALTMSRNPKARALGLGMMGLSYGGNKLYESPAVEGPGALDAARSVVGRAGGGAVTGYAGGKKVIQAGLDAVKKAFAPKPTKVVRASEALGPHEGKYLYVTESDRMRSTDGDLGGPGFSKFQLEDPRYAEAQAAWGVASKPKASSILNINRRFPEDKVLWSPMIGSEGQHRSNQHVYDMLTNEFSRQSNMGKLTPELREAMNQRLANFPKYAPSKLSGLDVANPEMLKEMGNTFDRRAAIAEVLGGEGVGGRKGQIFDYPGIMQEMTDPMTLGSPTHSVGTRLFSLSGDVEHRPDLHSAFPYILKGEDKGVAFNPVPKELMLGDWISQVKDFTGREPGYMEFMRGVKGGHGKPYQFLSEDLLRKLEEAGHKDGGPVHLAKGGDAFKEMVKAYKLFRTKPNDPETLYPLFVNANKPVPVGEWLQAEVGPLSASGKVKSKLGELAYRPGWHAGDLPVATHIGGKSTPGLRAPDVRPPGQVWAEVDMPADVDWQAIANERALRNQRGEIIPRTAHITDEIPFGGHYRYKTSPNMEGNWLISGDMRVNRVLSDEEVRAINEASGIYDLPRYSPLKIKAEGGLIHYAEGGHATAAWQRKEGQNPEGGLNAAGRASYHAETGGTLKPPVSAKEAKSSPKKAARRKSFCARMTGMPGPMKDESGNPTRKALALRKWDC